MEKISFLFYLNWEEQVDIMDNDELRRFIKNLCRNTRGEEVDLPTKAERLCWLGIAPALEINKVKYEKRIESNRENGKSGGAPKGNQNAKKMETTQNNPNNPIRDKRKEETENREEENREEETGNREEETDKRKEETEKRKEENDKRKQDIGYREGETDKSIEEIGNREEETDKSIKETENRKEENDKSEEETGKWELEHTGTGTRKLEDNLGEENNNFKRKHEYKTSYTGRKLTRDEFLRLPKEEQSDYVRFLLDLDLSEIGYTEKSILCRV
jgi:hypothetical protein